MFVAIGNSEYHENIDALTIFHERELPPNITFHEQKSPHVI